MPCVDILGWQRMRLNLVVNSIKAVLSFSEKYALHLKSLESSKFRRFVLNEVSALKTSKICGEFGLFFILHLNRKRQYISQQMRKKPELSFGQLDF